MIFLQMPQEDLSSVISTPMKVLWTYQNTVSLHILSQKNIIPFFITSLLDFVSSLHPPLPMSLQEALSHPSQHNAVEDKMSCLESNLLGSPRWGYKWVYMLKYQPDNAITRYKAQLSTSWMPYQMVWRMSSCMVSSRENMHASTSWISFIIDRETSCLRLKKSIHGLKQSPWAYFKS